MKPEKCQVMNHENDLDHMEHSTGILLNQQGAELGKLHVAKDPLQQQAARMRK
jgi:hypothetical protein